MNEFEYNVTLETLGKMQERLRNLEENDYMTAYYKGYSSEGATLDEIKDEISILLKDIEVVRNELNDSEYY